MASAAATHQVRQSLNGRSHPAGTEEFRDGHPSAAGVVPPPRMRRRPLLVVASVAVVCVGALLGAWAFGAVDSSEQVLAVRSTVPRGQVITRDDLMRVRIGADPALAVLPAADLEKVVGQRAAMDLAAGGLVTAASVTSSVVPGVGKSVVAVPAAAGAVPAMGLRTGDAVRIVLTPGQDGQYDAADTPAQVDATVVDVGTGDSGQSIVDVLVPADRAAAVAAMAATGKVILVLDSRER